MIAANKAVFGALDEYCSLRNDPVGTASHPRWITTNAADRRFLKYCKLRAWIPFGARRRVARFDLDKETFFCTTGFEHISDISEFTSIDANPGLLTLVLSELRPRPKESTVKIRDVVDATSKITDPNYQGHDPVLIASLFPTVRVYKCAALEEEDTWRVFLNLSVAECRSGESWIDDEFIKVLEALCELDSLNSCFRMLCRSIFDSDPGAMFLAVYRCLEAIYAYSHATKLMDELSLALPWNKVVASIENHLGWRPNEEASLAALMEQADAAQLKATLAALGEEPANFETSVLANVVAKRIYRLRNNLVHYRPLQQSEDYSTIDWNRLCGCMGNLVHEIYGKTLDKAQETSLQVAGLSGNIAAAAEPSQ